MRALQTTSTKLGHWILDRIVCGAGRYFGLGSAACRWCRETQRLLRSRSMSFGHCTVLPNYQLIVTVLDAKFIYLLLIPPIHELFATSNFYVKAVNENSSTNQRENLVFTVYLGPNNHFHLYLLLLYFWYFYHHPEYCTGIMFLPLRLFGDWKIFRLFTFYN